jgi:hypothetical protein
MAKSNPTMATLPQAELVALYPWERQDSESDRSFEAFEEYRKMGLSRSLVKVAEKLRKSEALINRWAARDQWRMRVLSYDRHEARITNERIILGTAGMRERMTMLAMQMQARAQNRILKMTEKEISEMRPVDVVALMRVAADIERKAREIPDEEMDSILPEFVPKFEIQVIRPGKKMVGVQMGDGRYGYIPEEQVERFRRDNPDAVVIA